MCVCVCVYLQSMCICNMCEMLCIRSPCTQLANAFWSLRATVPITTLVTAVVAHRARNLTRIVLCFISRRWIARLTSTMLVPPISVVVALVLHSLLAALGLSFRSLLFIALLLKCQPLHFQCFELNLESKLRVIVSTPCRLLGHLCSCFGFL